MPELRQKVTGVLLIMPHRVYCKLCEDDADVDVQENYPLCTIAHTPRLPEHCVEYVRLLMWPKDNPFGGLYPSDIYCRTCYCFAAVCTESQLFH